MRPLALFVAVAVLGSASLAHAQWTLPKGQGVVVLGYTYEFANSEWLGRHDMVHDERSYPLNGRYDGSTINLQVRAGFTENLELELDVPLKLVAYQSDPVLLALAPSAIVDPAEVMRFYRDNVLNFTRTATGVGDLQIAGRYRLLTSPIAIATEVRIKAPTGYTAPQGTFGTSTTTVDPSQANLRDDVTLGDGQLDIATSVLFGLALPTRTFARLGLGYNFRFGGAADQLLADLRVGQLIGDKFLIYVGVSGVYSVERDARSIGISVAAVDPKVAAADYTAGNLLPRQVFLERDAVDFAAGVIFKLTSEVELNLGFARTLWGANASAATQVNLSFAVRSQWDAPPPPPPEPAPMPAPVPVEQAPPPTNETVPTPVDQTAPPPAQPAQQ